MTPPQKPVTSGHVMLGLGVPMPLVGPVMTPKGAFVALLAELRGEELPTTTTPRFVGTSSPPALPAAPAVVSPVSAQEKHHTRDAAGSDAELDPLARQTAQMAPPPTPAREETAQEPAMRAARSLEDLVPELVRKIAWAGDARRGTVRMELGAGELAGSTLTVSAEGGAVTVQVHAAAGVDKNEWQRRLAERLAARGVRVAAVEVD